MALLRKRLKTAKRNRGVLRAHTALRCPLNGHQVGWCRGLCEPTGGLGLCGRLAPHGLQSRTQRAIAAHEAGRAAGRTRRRD